MEISLYYNSLEASHPIVQYSAFLKSKYRLNLSMIQSNHSQSSIGTLPVLQINTSLYPQEHIIPVLNHITGIESIQQNDYLNNSTIAQTLCIEELHHLTRLAHSLTLNPNFFRKIYLSYFFTSEFDRRAKVFEEIDSLHKMLSEILGEGNYFYEHLLMDNGPRSIDFIVYFCLNEERELLPNDCIFIKHSLNKYKNLLGFLERMENFLNCDEWDRSANVAIDEEFLNKKKVMLGKKVERLELNGFLKSKTSFSVIGFVLFFYLTLNG